MFVLLLHNIDLHTMKFFFMSCFICNGFACVSVRVFRIRVSANAYRVATNNNTCLHKVNNYILAQFTNGAFQFFKYKFSLS